MRPDKELFWTQKKAGRAKNSHSGAALNPNSNEPAMVDSEGPEETRDPQVPEATIAQEIFQRVAQGESLLEIADDLNFRLDPTQPAA